MEILLKRGDETATVTADDEMLNHSFAYSGIFERQVKLVISGFYPHLEQQNTIIEFIPKS